jgi:hypothetical protein
VNFCTISMPCFKTRGMSVARDHIRIGTLGHWKMTLCPSVHQRLLSEAMLTGAPAHDVHREDEQQLSSSNSQACTSRQHRAPGRDTGYRVTATLGPSLMMRHLPADMTVSSVSLENVNNLKSPYPITCFLNFILKPVYFSYIFWRQGLTM